MLDRITITGLLVCALGASATASQSFTAIAPLAQSGGGAFTTSAPVRQIEKQSDKGMIGVLLADGSGTPEIQSAIDGSPAAKAGLKAGDKISAVNGKPVASIQELGAALGKFSAGDTVKLSVVRGGWSKDLELTLAASSSLDLPAEPGVELEEIHEEPVLRDAEVREPQRVALRTTTSGSLDENTLKRLEALGYVSEGEGEVIELSQIGVDFRALEECEEVEECCEIEEECCDTAVECQVETECDATSECEIVCEVSTDASCESVAGTQLQTIRLGGVEGGTYQVMVVGDNGDCQVIGGSDCDAGAQAQCQGVDVTVGKPQVHTRAMMIQADGQIIDLTDLGAGSNMIIGGTCCDEAEPGCATGACCDEAEAGCESVSKGSFGFGGLPSGISVHGGEHDIDIEELLAGIDIEALHEAHGGGGELSFGLAVGGEHGANSWTWKSDGESSDESCDPFGGSDDCSDCADCDDACGDYCEEEASERVALRWDSAPQGHDVRVFRARAGSNAAEAPSSGFFFDDEGPHAPHGSALPQARVRREVRFAPDPRVQREVRRSVRPQVERRVRLERAPRRTGNDAQRAELDALRDELRALREEIRDLRDSLRRAHSGR